MSVLDGKKPMILQYILDFYYFVVNNLSKLAHTTTLHFLYQWKLLMHFIKKIITIKVIQLPTKDTLVIQPLEYVFLQ